MGARSMNKVGSISRRSKTRSKNSHVNQPVSAKIMDLLARTLEYPAESDGWGPSKPTARAYSVAKAVVMQMTQNPDLPHPLILPTPGGGLRLGWHRNERQLDLEISPEGGLEFLKLQGDKSA